MSRRRDERASVLLLFPVGVLIVLVLAAVAVDASIAFLGERELANAVAAAANDAATEALSESAFYRRGEVALNDSVVEQAAVERVRTGVDQERYRGLRIRASVVRPPGARCAWALEVGASARVRYIFAGIVPGASREATVDSTARSRPVQEETIC